MAEFLLELLSEEIPARMQVKAKDDLGSLVCKALDEADLTHGDVETFATPRRLVLTIAGLAARQPDVDVERKGPRVGAPEKAIDGFKRSLGTESYELSEEEDKKGAFYVARFKKLGRPTADVLAELLPVVLKNFPWPKAMRWGNHDVRWVRPLHSILCLLDGEVVPFSFGPVTSGNASRGHRFHAPAPFQVESVAQYKDELKDRQVIIDHAERRKIIKDQATTLAKDSGPALRLREDNALLDEIAGLVEWPNSVRGSIDAEFMKLPWEVLVTSMRAHQKYFAVEDIHHHLAPHFIAVANLSPVDEGAAIIAGNERVLRARLWDAKFFWDQDRRQPLDKLVPKLNEIVFHAKLGSVGDKVGRIEDLAPWIVDRARLVEHSTEFNKRPAQALKDELMANAGRAAHLAKADLLSGMVGEFPELQGYMGGQYALHQSESPDVSSAIINHYAPKGPDDSCPHQPVDIAVALADKLDTLAGFFAIDEKPTGSKDPFALRRAALGVIRMILENEVRLPLRQTILQALNGYINQLEVVEEAVVDDLLTFFSDRLKVHLRASGVRHDLISAVFATGDDDLVRILARVEALENFLASDDGANLLAAYRRANNIVKIETKKDNFNPGFDVDAELLIQPEELALYQRMTEAEKLIGPAIYEEKFAEAMTTLAALRKVVDDFFEHVMVNDEDEKLRQNRLKLLKGIHIALLDVANFSLIEDVTSDNDNRRVA